MGMTSEHVVNILNEAWETILAETDPADHAGLHKPDVMREYWRPTLDPECVEIVAVFVAGFNLTHTMDMFVGEWKWTIRHNAVERTSFNLDVRLRDTHVIHWMASIAGKEYVPV